MTYLRSKDTEHPKDLRCLRLSLQSKQKRKARTIISSYKRENQKMHQGI